MNEPRPPEVKPINESLPEVWRVEKDVIYEAWRAIESGIEYARESLLDHDTKLGRTTRKNKMWAEKIQRDIEVMINAGILIQKVLNAK